MTPEPFGLRPEISGIMATLPSHYREIRLMRDVDGMTNNEIAEYLGMDLATVKSRLHRARVAMRERLSQGGARS